MATKCSCRNTAQTTGISPNVDSGWEASASNFARCLFSTTRPGSDAITTVTVTETDSTNRNICVRQYIMPLKKGQTVTGAQAVQFVARFTETNAGNNMHSVFGMRVINQDGTVKKTILAVTREANEFDVGSPGTLESRNNTATSAATNYTTVAGDYLVVEIGAGGDPTSSNPHTYNISLGDNAANDLDASDVDTGADNPWFQLNDTLILEYSVDMPAIASASQVPSPAVQYSVTLPAISGTQIFAPTVPRMLLGATVNTNSSESLFDSAAGSDSNIISLNTGGLRAVGQGITGDGNVLTSARFRVSRSAAVTGLIWARLYAHSGSLGSGDPTGNPLAISQVLDASTLTGTPTTYTFNFGDGYQTAAGTNYFITIHWEGDGSANEVRIYSNTSSLHAGNNSGLDQTGTWGGVNSTDLNFSVFSRPRGTATVYAPESVEVVVGGDQAVTAGTIASGSSVNAPTVAYVVTNPVISGTSVFEPTLAYAVTTAFLSSGSVVRAPTLAYVVAAPAIASGSQAFSPTLAYVVANSTISAGQLFAPTVSPGAVTLTNATISSTTLSSPSVSYAVTTGTISSGNALFPPTTAYAVTTAAIASGNTLGAPATAYAVTTETVSTTAIFAPTISPGAVTLVNATISATVLSAPTVSTADSLSLPTIAGTQLFAPATAYAVSLAAIASGHTLAAPSASYVVNAATITSGTALYAPTADQNQELSSGTIASGSALFAPELAYQIDLAAIAATVLYLPFVQGGAEAPRVFVSVSDSAVTRLVLTDSVVGSLVASESIVSLQASDRSVGSLAASDAATLDLEVSDS